MTRLHTIEVKEGDGQPLYETQGREASSVVDEAERRGT
jgi:hypothetical protein